ncbi:MAG TPA: response regulator transcription factor [Ghiorsea sp.]|nr:response regulator transcription factor [Ghiorsea sp.]HIP07690.1 response regulator transcription factor [Mariprofundaceae bacterium]
MSKILIIDDHPLFRDSLSGMLQKEKLKGESPQVFLAEDAATALKIIHKNNDLDMVLSDIDMPGMDGLTLLQQIKSFLPNTIIVMVSGSENPADVQKAINFGAKGFIQKSSETSILLAALQLILAGGTYIPPLMLEQHVVSTHPRQETASLTPRQMDILQYLHQGQQNKVIAYKLDLSEATVKVHVRHIFSVLGVKNRTQAVQKALEIGIL